MNKHKPDILSIIMMIFASIVAVIFFYIDGEVTFGIVMWLLIMICGVLGKYEGEHDHKRR